MKKVTVTSLEEMNTSQMKEDVARTPLQRLELAFEISDLALEFHPNFKTGKEEEGSIQWIELKEIKPEDV